MDLILEEPYQLPDEDNAIVERARKALRKINREFIGVSPEGYSYHNVVCAVVWPKQEPVGKFAGIPLRLDFKAHTPGQIGQAWIGPDTVLTEDLFDGDNLTEDFRKEIEDSCDAFDEYMRTDFIPDSDA